jgi:DNA polymerase III subunit gamma/tau
MEKPRYLVTARKYRPRLFRELVAQEHVSETLKNAIRLDRLAHAYLFSGPRGVGKTTAARILAKAINCTTPADQRENAAEPCRECDSCQSFEEGRNLNIIEIDAASNNKVDDIRDLRDTVRVPPQGAKKKVYIVDEVHMLTSQAFNALLKTLEEPPPYVLFIFATTEPHKVLPTILSRCQRFDFRRISVDEIIGHLREICAQEDITADEASLMLIARKGDGALRDALSAFDQAVALCGTDLRYEELSRALGTVDIDLFFEATDAVLARDTAAMLRTADVLVQRGYDMQEFLAGLSEHLRNLFVARSTGETALIEATGQTQERYAAAAEGFDEAHLLRLMMITDAAETAIRNSPQPRLKLELALLKMATVATTVDLRTALDRIEKGLPEGVAPAAPSPRAEPKAKAAPAPAPAPPTTVSEPAPRPKPAPREAEEEMPPPPGHDEGPSSEPEPQRAPERRPPSPAPAPPAAPRAPGPELDSLFMEPSIKKRSEPENAGPALAVAVEEEPETVVEAAGVSEEQWADVLQAVRAAERVRIVALLADAVPVRLAGGTLVIRVPSEFIEAGLRGEEAFLVRTCRRVGLEEVARLAFDVEPPSREEQVERTDRDDPVEQVKRLKDEHPVVKALFDQFGGEIVYG